MSRGRPGARPIPGARRGSVGGRASGCPGARWGASPGCPRFLGCLWGTSPSRCGVGRNCYAGVSSNCFIRSGFFPFGVDCPNSCGTLRLGGRDAPRKGRNGKGIPAGPFTFLVLPASAVPSRRAQPVASPDLPSLMYRPGLSENAYAPPRRQGCPSAGMTPGCRRPALSPAGRWAVGTWRGSQLRENELTPARWVTGGLGVQTGIRGDMALPSGN